MPEPISNGPPHHTNVRGEPHMLAYITPEEAEFLRGLGRGVDRQGQQIMGPRGQIPAFFDGSPGGPGGGGNPAGGSAGGGAADGGAAGGGAAGGGDPAGPSGPGVAGSLGGAQSSAAAASQAAAAGVGDPAAQGGVAGNLGNNVTTAAAEESHAAAAQAAAESAVNSLAPGKFGIHSALVDPHPPLSQADAIGTLSAINAQANPVATDAVSAAIGAVPGIGSSVVGLGHIGNALSADSPNTGTVGSVAEALGVSDAPGFGGIGETAQAAADSIDGAPDSGPSPGPGGAGNPDAPFSEQVNQETKRFAGDPRSSNSLASDSFDSGIDIPQPVPDVVRAFRRRMGMPT